MIEKIIIAAIIVIAVAAVAKILIGYYVMYEVLHNLGVL